LRAFFELVCEYLAEVDDAHFHLEGGIDHSLQGKFADGMVPYFADVVVTHTDGRFYLAEESLGSSTEEEVELIGVPVIVDPYVTESGHPYLFPTLPRPSGAATREARPAFLLGVMAPRTTPPESVAVSIRVPAGSSGGRDTPSREISFPLHRGRVRLADREETDWRLTWLPNAGLPVLTVRSMSVQELAGMPESADTLRHQQAVILDLRGNNGGSDMPAMMWCRRFSDQEFGWVCGVALASGRPEPIRRWWSVRGRKLGDFGSTLPAAPSPYHGSLVVLADSGVASSGETFTAPGRAGWWGHGGGGEHGRMRALR
jgi:hypothetical protein